jgi:hypothetical protein
MPTKLTTEEFISRSIQIHGEKYIYTNTQYTNSNTLVNIICRIHGEIVVHPQSFLKGSGCRQCGNKTAQIKNRYSLDTFIEKAKEKFDYDYTETTYVSSNQKVKIICCEHGEFFQRPADHLRGHGCPECAYEKRTYTKIERGIILGPSQKEEFAVYTCKVWKHTEFNYRKHKEKIPKSSLDRSFEWHLDHVFSIYDGYINNVEPKIIGHYSNLQMLERVENITKSSKSWKSLYKLIEDYRQVK